MRIVMGASAAERAVVVRVGSVALPGDLEIPAGAAGIVVFAYGVIELNRDAYEKLPGIKRLAIVPGATHLFEEPGALEEVARLARDWFQKHLA